MGLFGSGAWWARTLSRLQLNGPSYGCQWTSYYLVPQKGLSPKNLSMDLIDDQVWILLHHTWKPMYSGDTYKILCTYIQYILVKSIRFTLYTKLKIRQACSTAGSNFLFVEHADLIWFLRKNLGLYSFVLCVVLTQLDLDLYQTRIQRNKIYIGFFFI